jgi:hypothetical protein
MDCAKQFELDYVQAVTKEELQMAEEQEQEQEQFDEGLYLYLYLYLYYAVAREVMQRVVEPNEQGGGYSL